MNKIISIFLIGFLFITFSCNEEDEIFPQIETLEIIPLSASNFLVKGTIVASGSSLVLEYGFVYSLSPIPDVFQGTKAVVGSGPTTGPIEKTISLESVGGSSVLFTVFVRAYITNQKGTVYGEVKEFTVPELTISGVAPLKAKTGDQITITGANFGLNPDENEVKFNEIVAEIVAMTSTSLTVKVPAGILYPFYNETNSIYVTTGGQTATATENFRLLPTVTDFSPKKGTFGTTITISGSDFYPFSTSVRIGSEDVSASQITDTSVTFNVPPEVTSQNLSIKLISGSDIINVPGVFTIEMPTITAVTPLSGLGGSTVIISGTGFNIGDFVFSYNTVKFGTFTAVAYNSGLNEITATVPVGLALGTYPISVFTGIHTVVFSSQFTLTKPIISGFSPTTAVPGTYVTISGSNFGLFHPQNTVLFGAEFVEIFNWNETSITVYIPPGTSSGSVKITVNVSGQSVTSAGSFIVQ